MDGEVKGVKVSGMVEGANGGIGSVQRKSRSIITASGLDQSSEVIEYRPLQATSEIQGSSHAHTGAPC